MNDTTIPISYFSGYHGDAVTQGEAVYLSHGCHDDKAEFLYIRNISTLLSCLIQQFLSTFHFVLMSVIVISIVKCFVWTGKVML